MQLVTGTYLEIDGRVVAGNKSLHFRPREEAQPVEGDNRAEAGAKRGNLSQVRNKRYEVLQLKGQGHEIWFG